MDKREEERNRVRKEGREGRSEKKGRKEDNQKGRK